jgi:hypothetical protein
MIFKTAVACLAAVLTGGCTDQGGGALGAQAAPGVPVDPFCAAWTPRTYSDAAQDRALTELEALPADDPLRQVVEEDYALRSALRACRGVRS